MRRWVVHLEAASERGDDLRLFAHRAENLIGMLYAHMETEEAVLLPLVDFGHLGNGDSRPSKPIGQHRRRMSVPGASRKA